MPTIPDFAQGPDFPLLYITLLAPARVAGAEISLNVALGYDVTAQVMSGVPELIQNMRSVNAVNRKQLNNVIETYGVRFRCTLLLLGLHGDELNVPIPSGSRDTGQVGLYNPTFFKFLSTQEPRAVYAYVQGIFAGDSWAGYFIISGAQGGITDRAENTYELTFEPIDATDANGNSVQFLWT